MQDVFLFIETRRLVSARSGQKSHISHLRARPRTRPVTGDPGEHKRMILFFVFTTLHLLRQTLSLRPENVTAVKDSENESEPENQVQLNEQ